MTKEELEIVGAIEKMGYNRTNYPESKVAEVIGKALKAMKQPRWILTNVSQDCTGDVHAARPTFFDTEDEAIKNAKTNLAEDFDISIEDVEEKAMIGGKPVCVSLSQDGRLEAYVISQLR